MDRTRDVEEPDIMEDMAEDLDRSIRTTDRPFRRQRGEHGMDPQKKAILFGGAGAVILIILLAVFFGGGDKGSAKELTTVKSRLDVIEKRLAKVEAAEQKISAVEGQMKGFQGSLAKLDSSTRSLRDQVERVGQKLEDQVKRAAPPAPPPTAKPQAQAAAPKKASAQGEKILHEVLPKETLFGIAKKYNLTIDELRRLNNLSKDDSIQPGQRLIVRSGNN